MTVAAQTRTQGPVDEQFPDDIEGYVATFNEDELRELDAANAAIDIAILLHRARTRRGLSQAQAAKMTGLKQQAISRLEQPGANPRLASIEAYLLALGYRLELQAVDAATGEIATAVEFADRHLSRSTHRN